LKPISLSTVSSNKKLYEGRYMTIIIEPEVKEFTHELWTEHVLRTTKIPDILKGMYLMNEEDCIYGSAYYLYYWMVMDDGVKDFYRMPVMLGSELPTVEKICSSGRFLKWATADDRMKAGKFIQIGMLNSYLKGEIENGYC
jgi:hypothetical protein